MKITPSAEFVRRLLEHAHDSIHIVDDQGVSVFDSASDVLGFPLDEVIGSRTSPIPASGSSRWRAHDLEVRVKRDGLAARARKSYVAAR